MKSLFDPIRFARGPGLRNRFVLAPLTNLQSLPDGRMSEVEHRWLEKRTHGGFGMMSTCAAGVQPDHRTMQGELGLYAERHVAPLARIAQRMKAGGNVAIVQLNHGGLRCDPRVTGVTPKGPYDEPEWGGRAMSTLEIQQLIEDFVIAAERAERAGFDGISVHGAHGQVLNQFLNPVRNLRTDGYGGSLEERSRPIRDILRGIRARCRPDFIIGLRLSVERFEIKLGEFRTLAERCMKAGLVDFMDFSLWDVMKEPVEEEYKGKPLIAWVTDLERGDALIGVAGKITTGARAAACVAAGSDYVTIGRGAILHHDFPRRVAADPAFCARALPVPVEHLREEAVTGAFVDYLRRWDGFVADAPRGMYTDVADLVDGSEVAICLDPATADGALVA